MSTFLNSISPVIGAGESVSSVTLTPSVIPGMEARDASGNKYVYVYNAGVEQISQGRAAVLSAVSGYSVSVSSTSGADMAIGVARNATINTSAYGWLLVQGFSGFESAAGDSFVTGNLLAIGVDGKFAQKTQATGAFGANVVGKCVLSVASASVTFINAAYFNF